MNRLLIGLSAFGIAACSSGKIDAPPSPPNTIAVAIGGGTVTAEIAATNAARETGLMGRASLAANAGMVFVFVADQPVPPTPFAPYFWMKDTPIDLAIAFLDVDKRVVTVDEMQANTLTPHNAARPYRYALEANRGWFAAHNVAVGTQATFTLPAGVIPSR